MTGLHFNQQEPWEKESEGERVMTAPFFFFGTFILWAMTSKQNSRLPYKFREECRERKIITWITLKFCFWFPLPVSEVNPAHVRAKYYGWKIFHWLKSEEAYSNGQQYCKRWQPLHRIGKRQKVGVRDNSSMSRIYWMISYGVIFFEEHYCKKVHTLAFTFNKGSSWSGMICLMPTKKPERTPWNPERGI